MNEEGKEEGREGGKKKRKKGRQQPISVTNTQASCVLDPTTRATGGSTMELKPLTPTQRVTSSCSC